MAWAFFCFGRERQEIYGYPVPACEYTLPVSVWLLQSADQCAPQWGSFWPPQDWGSIWIVDDLVVTAMWTLQNQCRLDYAAVVQRWVGATNAVLPFLEQKARTRQCGWQILFPFAYYSFNQQRQSCPKERKLTLAKTMTNTRYHAFLLATCLPAINTDRTTQPSLRLKISKTRTTK